MAAHFTGEEWKPTLLSRTKVSLTESNRFVPNSIAAVVERVMRVNQLKLFGQCGRRGVPEALHDAILHQKGSERHLIGSAIAALAACCACRLA